VKFINKNTIKLDKIISELDKFVYMSEIAMGALWASAQSNPAMLRSKASGTAIAVSEHAQKLRNTLRTLVRSF